MKALLFILPLCLFITFFTKRTRNPYSIANGEQDLQICLENDDTEENNIDGRPSLLKNHTLARADDASGGSGYRQVFSGIPGYFYFTAIKKYASSCTQNTTRKIIIGRPYRLCNKGSPKNENTRIHYVSAYLKNKRCLFPLLPQSYLWSARFNRDHAPLRTPVQYSLRIHLLPPFSTEALCLYFEQHPYLRGYLPLLYQTVPLLKKSYFFLNKMVCFCFPVYRLDREEIAPLKNQLL